MVIETQLHIPASPERVWKTLTDFECVPEWNSLVRHIEGQAIVGKKIRVDIALPDSKSPMKFKPVILRFDENNEFRWKGTLGIPGLFDGEHYFILKRSANGETDFIHGEKFSGILLVFFGSKFKQQVQNGFEQFNKDLNGATVEGNALST